ncbi:uncharacterized protein LOC130670244 [Microplitis mediator]|uniref:uncharacterized protein LOC130670244 n=1 Tax=Microplitis mediator TaxID=375433 RepID=UPI002555EF9D|nr:uncharacterized protein LOC130670244 [Microplitis mediator]
MSEDADIKTFEEAVKEVDDILRCFNGLTRNAIVSHIVTTWLAERIGSMPGSSNAEQNHLEVANGAGQDENNDDSEVLDDPIMALERIVASLKSKVPRSGILPSETFITSNKQENSGPDSDTTIHIDGFLYDEEDLETLEDDGDLARYYCEDCGSKKIKFLNIISNSMNREELFHIFNDYLPTLDGKIVLDVGSRLGAVLYGAYVFTDAEKIIGVEMNKEFCDIQNQIVKEFKMIKRVEVINKDIKNAADVLKSADVVVLNNVFESYLPEDKQAEMWNFLKEHIKKGAFIVSRPHIKEILDKLDVNINVDEWVKKVEGTEGSCQTEIKSVTVEIPLSKIACYVVL